MARFKSPNSIPPGGKFFFALNGKSIEAGHRAVITAGARRLFEEQGLVPPFDPFEAVMAYMCDHMPDGFCTEPAKRPLLHVGKVKTNTAALFGKRAAAPVVVRERLHVCMACPANDKVTCPSCSGLLDWVIKGVGNRTRIPADDFVYVCRPGSVFGSAVASVDDPGPPPEGCPETCWWRLEYENRK